MTPANVHDRPPAEVMALAEEKRLGEYHKSFHPQRMQAWRVILMFPMILIGLMALVVPGLYFIWFMFQQPNFNKKQAARRMHFFEHGLVVTWPERPAAAIRWDSVSVLQEITHTRVYGVGVATEYKYHLTDLTGSTVKLTGFFAQPGEWGPGVQNEVTRAKLPSAVAALERGESLPFGDLTISEEGITSAKRGLARWSDIETVTVQDGRVFVKKSGKWTSWSAVDIKKIPNVFLFFTLVDQLLEEAHG